MINITNLNKSYGKDIVLKDVNFNLEEGKIYGLLGRNGVGKSTLLSIRKDQGEIKLFGEEVFENSKVVEEICLIKEKGFGVDDIKVKKMFDIARILYKNWDENYKNFLSEKFNINTKKKYSKLSRGNQTIVGLIIGLASRSKLTMFDEPILGLDAAFRDLFYKLLLEDIEKNPRTVIISTHLIDEVTNLFEEIIILKNGTVYIKDEVSTLLEKAYFLSGMLNSMKDVIENKNVITRESFGTSTIVGIFDDLSEEEKLDLKKNNIDINSMPLQKLFVSLTKDIDSKEVE